MDKLGLLKAVYQSIDWSKFYTILPETQRQHVDMLFQELREMLGGKATAAAETPTLQLRKEEVAAIEWPTEELAVKVARGAADLYCDGASSGNPGPAGIGIVIQAPDGTRVLARGAAIGRATNNVAEYRAAIEGLKTALKLEVRRIRILSDSELLVKQLRGDYAVKTAHLKILHGEMMALLRQFTGWEARHIPREKNTEADALATQHARDAKGEAR